jgi:hypothetical protein
MKAKLFRTRGHEAHSRYADLFWTPILGPSSMLLWRRLVEELEPAAGATEVDVAMLCREFGVTKGDVVRRTFARLQRYNVVQLGTDGAAAVVTSMPAVSYRMLERLPTRLQAAHAVFLEEAEVA